MGVKGLWRLLLPIGRRISLETLEGKVLAIDASIWLTQFLKALRDPQTGKSQPAAHLIGFVRRLCRLYFHGIRPVLVFDGATPEIKYREIQNRRRRREKFSSTTTSHQQRARRLLTEQLQKRNLSASARKEATKTAKKASNRYAPGFNPGAQARSPKLKDPPPPVVDEKSKESASKAALEDEAAILAAIREDFEAEEDEKKKSNTTNDWDDVVVIGETDQAERTEEGSEDEEKAEYEDFGLRQAKIRFKKQIDMNYISSLPANQRKDAIEDAKKQQRLQSRREFMPAAGNPDQFSSVQLANFLKSSRLNLNIQKLAKTEVQRNNKYGGDVMASDRTTRISLIREDEGGETKMEARGESEDEPMENDPLFRQRPSKRKTFTLKRTSSSDEEGDHIEWDTGKVSGLSSGGRRVLMDDDSVEDDGVQSEKRQKRTINNTFPVAAGLSHDFSASSQNATLSDDFGGGGSLPSATKLVQSNRSSQTLDDLAGVFIAPSIEGSEQNIHIGDRQLSYEGSDGGGGGFLTDADRTAPTKRINTLEIKDGHIEDSMLSMEKESGDDTANDARLVQEMGDAILAQALQGEHDPIYQAGKPTTSRVTLTVEGESSDDEVDWEEEDIKSTGPTDLTHSTKTPPLVKPTPTRVKLTVDNESSDDDDDVDWEDGDVEIEGSPGAQLSTKANPSIGNEEEEGKILSTQRVFEGDNRSDDKAECLGEKNTSKNNSVLELDAFSQGVPEENTRKDRQDGEGNECDVNEASDVKVMGLEASKERAKLNSVLGVDAAIQENVSTTDAVVERHLLVEIAAEDDKTSNSQWGIDVNEWGSTEGATSPRKQMISTHHTHELDNSSDSSNPNETSAAFARAEATAANLAGWAGRAFRRAMRESGKFDQPKESKKDDTSAPLGEVIGPVSQPTIDPNSYVTNATSARASSPSVVPQRASASQQNLRPHLSDAAQAKASTTTKLKEYEDQWAKERNQQERDSDTVTDEMKEEVMTLLRLFGVPYVESPAEAEAQCAALEQLGLVDGIVTEDSDVFIFGGKKIYKNIFDERLYAEAYMADDAEREMAINRNGMVALAMLLGSDYTEGVRGVGIVNAMEVLRAFDVSEDVKEGLVTFRKWLDGFDPSDRSAKPSDGDEVTPLKAFHAQHRSARSRWEAPEHFPADNIINAYTRPVVDTNPEKFTWGQCDVEGLVEFCSRHIGWQEEETRRMLEPVVKRNESGERYRQTRLDSFMRYEDGIRFADVKSKRLRSVLGLKEDDVD
mmetsp:Transcript_10905/g.22305  ORF Transcript_10905/g.22305 Transcript_10905/m.22305 type:complete len:1255 (-) Transcript_10905:122-3886(-)